MADFMGSGVELCDVWTGHNRNLDPMPRRPILRPHTWPKVAALCDDSPSVTLRAILHHEIAAKLHHVITAKLHRLAGCFGHLSAWAGEAMTW